MRPLSTPPLCGESFSLPAARGETKTPILTCPPKGGRSPQTLCVVFVPAFPNLSSDPKLRPGGCGALSPRIDPVVLAVPAPESPEACSSSDLGS